MAMTRNLSFGGSSRLGLLLALGLALVAGVLVFVAASRGGDGEETVRSATGGGATTILTASRDIPARTEITASMVQLTAVSENAVLPGAFDRESLVVGRIARIPIYEGEQLVQEKLASEKTDLGLAYIVEPGRRAMAVEVDKVIGAGGLIRPGDRVDIIAVIDINYEDLSTEREVTVTRSFIVAQNIEVLAVEQDLENQPLRVAAEDGAEAAGEDAAEAAALVDQPEAQPDGEVVTLSLAPAEMQNLLLVDEKGEIRLAVRAPGDHEIVELTDSSPILLTDEDFRTVIVEILAQPKD